MPNSANKSNGRNNSGQGQKHQPTEQTSNNTQKPNPERSDIRHGTDENDGNTNRTSSQGRKESSGGETE